MRAAALVLRRALPRLPLGLIYVPKGPALDYNDEAALEFVLETLEDIAHKSRSIFIKIDPDVSEEESHLAGPVKALLNRRGWCFSPEQVQFKNTLCVDLRRSEDELLKAMKAKTRYNIHLASRRGVEVRPGALEDIETFYQLYRETALRDSFIIRPPAYYYDAWGTFMRAGLARLFLALHEGEVLAGLLLFHLGKRAWYMYGASSDRKRQVMSNYLLQWEAMLWAKAQGCAIYDMWGAPDILDESDPLWGVYRFKAGFGGSFVRHIGAYDYPVWPAFYKLYHIAVPRYLSFLRRRHRVGGNFS